MSHRDEKEQFEVALARGLRQLNVHLSAESVEQLWRFTALLIKWNNVFNLSAITEVEKIVSHHLLDSLAAMPYISGERVVDVGTGAGLPGIPLAVAFPHKQFLLLDSNRKKTRFVTQAVMELQIRNVDTVTQRVAEFEPSCFFDIVVTRAFASIESIIVGTRHLISSTGKFVLLRGKVSAAEISRLDSGFIVEDVKRLCVPGVEGQRHVVIIAPAVQG